MSREIKKSGYIDPGSPERVRFLLGNLPNFSGDSPIGFFFTLALEAYYDRWTSPSGMQTITGHILFRLSDAVDENERRAMHIYPDKSGSVMVDLQYEDAPLTSFASLEDWREVWMRQHPEGVPPLEQLWPNAPKLLSQFQEPRA